MAENLPGNDGSTQEQVLTLVGLWLQSLLYGGYAVMFFAAISFSLKNRRTGGSFSMVLFLSMISMFIMITLFTCINLHRGIQAYALTAVPPKPVNYYHNLAQWDNFSFGVIVSMLTWHADAVMIYRCFIIHSRNFWVIVVPCILLVVSFVSGTIFLTWARNPAAVPVKVAMAMVDMAYPINVTQSLLTTGLIAWKIYSQHQRAVAAGISRKATGGVNLLTIIRIFIESAMIFTVQQVILLILLQLKSPAQVIFHATTIPSIGIVFVLIALRTHFAQTASEVHNVPSGKYTSNITSGSHRPGQGSIAVITTRSVHEDLPMRTLNIRSNLDGREEISDDAKSPTGSYSVFEKSKPQPV